MPWKIVRQFWPCTSSVISLNFLNATSSFCRSARLTSKMRPLRPSDAILVPWVLVTSVFPIFHIEHSWCLHIIPIFLRKLVHHFLLGSLFATFHKAPVLTNTHGAALGAKRAYSFSDGDYKMPFCPIHLILELLATMWLPCGHWCPLSLLLGDLFFF